MATHSSILAWEIPWTEEPGRLQSMGSQRVDTTERPMLLVLLLEKEAADSEFSSVQSFSRVQLFATPWTVAYQAPPSMGFSRQECWSGLPFPSPGDLPHPGIEPRSPALWADALPSEPLGNTCSLRAPQGL